MIFINNENGIIAIKSYLKLPFIYFLLIANKSLLTFYHVPVLKSVMNSRSIETKNIASKVMSIVKKKSNDEGPASKNEAI